MSKMMRQPSHTGSIATSNLNSPRARLSFFKKRPSRDEQSSEEVSRSHRPPRSPADQGVQVQHAQNSTYFALPDLELSRSFGLGSHSPDPFLGTNHDPEYIQLRENIRRLRKAPSGSEAKSVDAIWDVYKKVREDSLELCKVLFQKSREYLIHPARYRQDYLGILSEFWLTPCQNVKVAPHPSIVALWIRSHPVQSPQINGLH